VLTAIVDEFNLRFSQPQDMKEGKPWAQFISSIMPDTIVSPMVADEFIMIGFNM